MTRFLDVETVVEVNKQFSSGGVRDMSALRSAVLECQQGAFDQEFHPTLADKAAALLRGIARNHAFVDGNKRTALTVADMFLRANGRHLEADQNDLVEFTVSAAEGILDSETIAKQLSIWTVSNTRPLDIGIERTQQFSDASSALPLGLH